MSFNGSWHIDVLRRLVTFRSISDPQRIQSPAVPFNSFSLFQHIILFPTRFPSGADRKELHTVKFNISIGIGVFFNPYTTVNTVWKLSAGDTL